MSDTALRLTNEVAQDFLYRNKNLLALVKEGPKGAMKRVEAALTLLEENAKSDVLMFLDVVDQKGYAGQIGRADFKAAMYASMAKAFLRAQRNCVVLFSTKLTPEALAELEAIEVAAGEREPAPPPPPQKSQAELLEAQVRADWSGKSAIPTDKLKAKMNRDPQYREVFNRLMAANQLESVATSYTDGAAEFRR